MIRSENINPLVSIVLATYNGEKYLTQQIESICKQTYPNIEIIICDDCSSDETKNIIRSFSLIDKRIKPHYNEINFGLNKNFESGILKSKGEFVCISDQDDVWFEEKVERMLAFFKEENVVLTHSQSIAFSSEAPPSMYELKHKRTIMMSGSDSRKLLLQNSISGHNMMFRKALIPIITPIPHGIYYDWWIAMVATTAGEIKACPFYLTFHRHHSLNLTQKNKKAARQNKQEWEERRDALRLFLGIPNLSQSAKSLAFSLFTEWEKLGHQNFSLKLFRLILKNADIFFYHKRKRIRLFSFIKASYRLSQVVKR